MEDGGWRMEDGEGRMEDGGGKREDGGWRREEGRREKGEEEMLILRCVFEDLASTVNVSFEVLKKTHRLYY